MPASLNETGGPPRIGRWPFLVMAVSMAVGCSDPGEPELVPHKYPRGYVYGFVTTEAGAPVDSIRVIGEVFGASDFVPDCGSAEFSGETWATAKTDTTGRFSMKIEFGALPKEAEICLGIRTSPSQGSAFLESIQKGIFLTVRPNAPWDSVRVDLTAIEKQGA